MPTIWLSATSTHCPGANSVEAVNVISNTQRKMVGLCGRLDHLARRHWRIGGQADIGQRFLQRQGAEHQREHSQHHQIQPPGQPQSIGRQRQHRTCHQPTGIPGVKNGKARHPVMRIKRAGERIDYRLNKSQPKPCTTMPIRMPV